MLQPLDEHRGQVGDVAGPAPDQVLLEDGDDLVVGLVPVDELKAADDARTHQDLGPGDRALAQHTNVERITITDFCAGRQGCDTLPAVRPGNESVKGGRLRGGSLWAIESKVTGALIDFVLHQIERSDLDEDIDEPWSILPG